MDPKNSDPNNPNNPSPLNPGQADLGSVLSPPTTTQDSVSQVDQNPPISQPSPTLPFTSETISPATTPLDLSSSAPTELPSTKEPDSTGASVSSIFPPTTDAPITQSYPNQANLAPTEVPDPLIGSASPQDNGLTPPPSPLPTFTPPTTEISNPNLANSQSPTDPNFNWSSSPTQNPPATEPTSFPQLEPYTTTQPSDLTPTHSEPAPTDLSHLENQATEPAPSVYTPPLSQPETLVAQASSTNSEIPNIPTENEHKGIPMWLIGVGVGLFLVVTAASAYFILGVGRAPQPESVPAVTNEEQTLVAPPIVVQTPLPTNPVATSSTELEGGTPTQATSAADLLRQRQGR